MKKAKVFKLKKGGVQIFQVAWFANFNIQELHTKNFTTLKEAEDFSELARKAIVDEDYPMNFKIQDSINSKANKEFIFGRNEPIQQHYHKWVDKLSSK